jgi:hypothetical protein
VSYPRTDPSVLVIGSLTMAALKGEDTYTPAYAETPPARNHHPLSRARVRESGSPPPAS